MVDETEDERLRILAHLEVEALRRVPEFDWKNRDPDQDTPKVQLLRGGDLARLIVSEIIATHLDDCGCGDCRWLRGVPVEKQIQQRIRAKKVDAIQHEPLAPFVPIVEKKQNSAPFEKRKFDPQLVRDRAMDEPGWRKIAGTSV